jgi:hypothetical protein
MDVDPHQVESALAAARGGIGEDGATLTGVAGSASQVRQEPALSKTGQMPLANAFAIDFRRHFIMPGTTVRSLRSLAARAA